MRRERNPFLTAYAVLVYLVLFAPIAILILFSFNDSRRTLRWHGFTTDWYGRHKSTASMRNDFFIDREAQKANKGSIGYTGITGPLQDQAITESMGPVYDRSQEHLGTTDAMVIRVRAGAVTQQVSVDVAQRELPDAPHPFGRERHAAFAVH